MTDRSAPREPLRGEMQWLVVCGARHNNLKNLDVFIPLGRFVCITGVSGSGKSSLINDIVWQRLARDLNGEESAQPGLHDDVLGIEHLHRVIDIDQSPIGRTPRSNPATYIKLFDAIRDLYARLPDSRVRGYKPGRFSFNVPAGRQAGGRCEACEGNGANRIEMDFLADVWVTCTVCDGRRFERETLSILFKEKSIADVLEMDAEHAASHFSEIPAIHAMLNTLLCVGLNYIKLGQPSTTLSGGEAQRIKLARQLVKRPIGSTLYILDEPTTGLHFDDIRKLLSVLHGFVDAGHSVVVVEHNLDVIKTADWIIDLGPEGGDSGGHIVAEGTPEEIAQADGSHTGQALRMMLNGSRVAAGGAACGLKRTSTIKSRRKTGYDRITVEGARQHNLKHIDVSIPRGKTTVFTGVSGSGKTSLAIDTLYAEGHRRYVESLSAYARQFVGRLERPAVDRISGLSPAIAIDQKSPIQSPRSTVGTVTEIYDYMRLLWARVGKPHCPRCGEAVLRHSAEGVVNHLLAIKGRGLVTLLAPLEIGREGSWQERLRQARADGFSRVRIDGQIYSLDEAIPMDAKSRPSVDLVVDRISLSSVQRPRLTDSVEQTLRVGSGRMKAVVSVGAGSSGNDAGRELFFSEMRECGRCGVTYDELTPHHFSFNSRMGWCDGCEGLGVQRGLGGNMVAVHPERSILAGALAGWDNPRGNPPAVAVLAALARHLDVDPHTPWSQLGEQQRNAILFGADDTWIELAAENGVVPASWRGVRFRWRGYSPAIDRASRSSWQYRKRFEGLVSEVSCRSCGGSRLKPHPRAVQINGRRIEEVCRLPLSAAMTFFAGLSLSPTERKIAGVLMRELLSRLRFLCDVGLPYLTLDRPAPTLSGGESQRIRLASQIGSGLTGVLYILDEPTIGLHPRDNARLIGALQSLRRLGNSLVIVEHDRQVIAHADHIVDFGPGAGRDGGMVVADGAPARFKRRKSLTARYLSGREAIPVPTNRRPVDDSADAIPERRLIVHNARMYNLKGIDVSFPLGRFIAVTGVSGSGKSSLVRDTLYRGLAARIQGQSTQPQTNGAVSGAEFIDKVIDIDQSPLGHSPTSNAATYTGIFDIVRELYARLPESRIRGYTANRFSFNRPGGRCEACEGAGRRCIEMHFLPDVWIECENCRGRRYVRETLEVAFHGRSIADVLEMRVAEARTLFQAVGKLQRMLQTLEDVGLGYLPLGQPAPALSGGEAQRVKLAAELGRPSTGNTLYILDEPTTGLHFDDVRQLLDVLHRLVDLGNTVVCVEHNLDVIKTADYVIDMGPDAADEGGRVVVAGTPESVARCSDSFTGIALRPVLKAGPHRERVPADRIEREAVEAELSRPLDVRAALAHQPAPPWETDGKAWHTADHRDRAGRPVQWSTEVLEWLVEVIERMDGFAPADWNDRTRVELRAAGDVPMWFAHLLTGGRELLDISLRVPRGRFTERSLRRGLKIKTLDERTDLPLYGQGDRVRVRRVDARHDDIRLQLRDFGDIHKPTFRQFLEEAGRAYLEATQNHSLVTETATATPEDGRHRHLSQESIRHRDRIRWEPSCLLQIVGRIRKTDPTIELDWNAKVCVGLRRPGRSASLGRIVTNRPEGLRCEFRVPYGVFTPVRIEGLGSSTSIRRCRLEDIITFWIRTVDENDAGQLAKVIRSSMPSRHERSSA